MNGDYKVGYGRPPKVYRFKKGQSGNPLGSSRKARKRQRRQVLSFDDVVLDDARKPIRIREGNRTSTISLKEALLQKQYAMGLNGNRLALKVSLDMIAEAEHNQREQMLDLYEAAHDYKKRIIRPERSVAAIAVWRHYCRIPRMCSSTLIPAR
jgi:Family of unknown function (DUF5681)